jgi:hypothetical protein
MIYWWASIVAGRYWHGATPFCSCTWFDLWCWAVPGVWWWHCGDWLQDGTYVHTWSEVCSLMYAHTYTVHTFVRDADGRCWAEEASPALKMKVINLLVLCYWQPREWAWWLLAWVLSNRGIGMVVARMISDGIMVGSHEDWNLTKSQESIGNDSR